MEPRISSVTIFVDDLSRSFAFYRRLFEIPHEQMVIHEDHVAFFFENDLSLVLLENVGAKASQMMLTHAAEFADDVDAILQRVVAAGGQVVQWPEKDASSYAALFEDQMATYGKRLRGYNGRGERCLVHRPDRF